MKLIFFSIAWEDYLYWQQTDKAILRKINALLKEIERQPFNRMVVAKGKLRTTLSL